MKNLLLARKRQSENESESIAFATVVTAPSADKDTAYESPDNVDSEWNQSQIEVERGELNDRLEAFFKEELEQIAENTLEVTEQREKLSKFSMLSSIEKSADLILCD